MFGCRCVCDCGCVCLAVDVCVTVDVCLAVDVCSSIKYTLGHFINQIEMVNDSSSGFQSINDITS